MNECLRCGNRWTDKRLHCPKCGLEKEVITNADRIRAMSDEELTEFLKHWNWDNYIVMGKSVVNDWLKQEVE